MPRVQLVATCLPVVALAVAGCQRDPLSIPDPVETEFIEASPDFGSWLSMDVAPDGERLAIAYYDRDRLALAFATGTPQGSGITWEHEPVDGFPDPESGLPTGDRGKYASMKVADDGTVWITYFDEGRGDLMYAHRPGLRGPAPAYLPVWNTGIIDPGEGTASRAGKWTSLAFDSNGAPVVAYQDEGLGALKIARPVGLDNGSVDLQWTSEIVYQGQPYSGTDAEGQPVARGAAAGLMARLEIVGATEFIAFYDAAQQRMGYVEGSPGNYPPPLWVTDVDSKSGQWPSLLVKTDEVHIAFHDAGAQQLMLATKNSAGFTVTPVDASRYVGADTEIIERGGDLQILYFDGQYNDVKLARRAADLWVPETLLSEGAVGFHNEIVRTNTGWYAGSYDFVTRTVKVVELAGPGGGS